MTPGILEIERVVREVLAEMGLAPAADARAKSDAPVRRSPGDGAEEADAGSLALTGRVIAAGEVEGRLAGVRRVIVSPDAVLTPSAVDLLKAAGVTWTRRDRKAALPASGWAVRLIAAGRSCDPQPLRESLEGDGHAVEVDRTDCLIAASQRAAESVRDGRSMAVMLSRHPAAALCLANRHASVRAILAASIESVARDAEAVGANAIVVDPTAQSFFAMRQLVRRFLDAGPRSCPEAYQKQLA